MIANNTGNGWAQSGYIWRHGIATSYTFAQYSKNGSAFATAYMNDSPSTALYYVNYDFNGADLQMIAHANTLLTSTWDPIVEWTAPWVSEWEGETHYQGDDVPGSQSATTNFSSDEIKTTRTGSLVDPSGLSLATTNTNYGAAWGTIAQEQFHIWSKS